ncbi:hypothetical protein ECV0102_07890 [Enterobacter cloacae]|nr:hypothetical protein ECV0102_07890 [Enterobacter cloacae]
MEKAKYRVLRLSHIHNNLWPEGSEIEYEGEPGSALEPLNAAAEKAKAAALKKRGVEFVKPELKVDDCNSNDNTGGDDELEKLREEYEVLFNDKPRPNTGVKTLREKIAEKRAELGV